MIENLFTFKKIGAKIYEITLTDENHPIFKAHFPNNPILPGFIYVNMCEYLLNHHIVYIKKAKFINFSKPNDILLLKYEKSNEVYNIIFTCKDKNICTISYKIDKGE
jgi:3-hydroxymyristoyl/3-hydroxydecanoyl-(acyl carrier protein) dehydratase